MGELENQNHHSHNVSGASEEPSVDPTAKIVHSSLAHGVTIYRFATVTESTLEKNSIVGDFTRITNTHLGSYGKIDRFNNIHHSQIDDYSYTGMNDVIMYSSIGKFCSISWGVTIGAADHDHHKITSHDFTYKPFYGLIPDDIVEIRVPDRGRTTIGNDVWIGANATILRNVVIGDGAVIGANTIVTKNVPPYAIVVGNPGRIMKYRFPEKIIEQLLKLQWWNLPKEMIKRHHSSFSSDDIEYALQEIKRDIRE